VKVEASYVSGVGYSGESSRFGSALADTACGVAPDDRLPTRPLVESAPLS
jgi:hypothetical protein